MTTDQLSALLAQDPAAVLEHDRRLYEQQIVRAADLIAAHAQERPAVLLAGPSGSGKTTTALLIERELDRRGMETHTLSMDDYFCPLTERELELFSRNELDLERPSRVDVPFFQEQLGKLLAGEEVELPHYDFKNSVRVFDGRTLRRRPGELVILEGIHALNPEVTGYDGRTTRIYVSVRTRITPRSGHPLHPSKIRLVRRMLRDSTGRGRALSETIAMRERVDRGEQRYIMPFKPRAHGSIDSFYSAELGVYRPLLRDELERLALPELSDVVEVMRELPDVPAAPADCKFVGIGLGHLAVAVPEALASAVPQDPQEKFQVKFFHTAWGHGAPDLPPVAPVPAIGLPEALEPVEIEKNDLVCQFHPLPVGEAAVISVYHPAFLLKPGQQEGQSVPVASLLPTRKKVQGVQVQHRAGVPFP